MKHEKRVVAVFVDIYTQTQTWWKELMMTNSNTVSLNKLCLTSSLYWQFNPMYDAFSKYNVSKSLSEKSWITLMQ